MTTAVRRRRGTTAQHATFTGLEGEISIDTTKDTVVVHDGTTAGGHPLAKENNTALTGNVTVTTNSSSTALTITQDGTGNALEVRDVTGDTSPFVVDASGNVGVGGSSSGGKLEVIPGSVGNAIRVRANTTNIGILQFTDAAASTEWAYVAASSGSLDINHPSVTRLLVGGGEKFRVNSSSQALAMDSTGLGYGTGSGGTVTQATSKSTAVTLNKPSGQITMHNAALAAGASVGFQFTNSAIAFNDTVTATGAWTAVDPNNYRIEVRRVAAGEAQILVTNTSGGSLSEALAINFNVHKGSAS